MQARELTIYDVLSALDLPFPPEGKSHYSVTCPRCDATSRKKKAGRHLDIHLSKGVFRCAKCGVHGGLLDLYCLYKGEEPSVENRRKAAKLIREDDRPLAPRPERKAPPKEEPMAPIGVRDDTYRAFFSLLPLTPKHRENLLARGLTDADITRIGYKSAPYEAHQAQEICHLLELGGFSLRGVPGFYKANGEWTIGWKSSGILVPYKDVDGRIQGIQKRLDDTSKRKFRWLSGADLECGTPAACFTHFAGDPDCQTVYITEGGMKADVIYTLSGRSVLAVPGVNSLQSLQAALEELRENHNLRKVVTAFDMDYLSNEFVQRAYDDLLRFLDNLGFEIIRLSWDETYKGLDDWLLAQKIKREGARE